MKINKKIIVSIFMVVCMIVAVSTIYAKDWGFINNSTSVGKVEHVAKNVWATISVIVQILSVGAVVYAGVRYMICSADEKANIKKELGYLALGAAIVFGATTIIKFIADSATNILN